MRRTAAWAASGIVLVTACAVASADVVVLRSGGRLLATGPPDFAQDRVLVPLVGGSTGSLRRTDVDEEATRRANESGSRLSWKYKELAWWPQPPMPALPPPPPPLGLIAPGGARGRSCYSSDDLSAPTAPGPRIAEDPPATPGPHAVEVLPPALPEPAPRARGTGRAVIGAEGPLLSMPGFPPSARSR